MNNALHGKRILLADDHAVVRLGFRLLLEGAGASVVAETDNGESAVRLYAETNPDVVVMDVSMPALAASLRSNACSSGKPRPRC
jgi:two-component system invasion response regulator UvrY